MLSNKYCRTIIIVLILTTVLLGLCLVVNKNGEKKSNAIKLHKYIQPQEAKWDKGSALGALMPYLDFGNDSHIIFHSFFGLFVYDLEEEKISRSLDLATIGCDGMQGDNHCDIKVTKDGNKLYLHPAKNLNMYIFDLAAKPSESLYEVEYQELPQNKTFQTVNISNVNELSRGTYSDAAIEYEQNGNRYYGYLQATEYTIGMLRYVKNNKVYMLFS